MTVRIPLVIVGGQVEQLQSGDTIAGSSAGVPTTMQGNFSVAAHTQQTYRQHIVAGSFSIIIGSDASLISV